MSYSYNNYIKDNHLQPQKVKLSQICVFWAVQCNLAKNCLTGRAPLPDWSRTLTALFEGLTGVQIRCKIARWKGLRVYFPAPPEVVNLELIGPLKSHFSQDIFLQLKIVAESQNLHVF